MNIHTCMCVYIHKFFTHSFTHGHLGCFHILAVVNKASVNMETHLSFQISFKISSDKYPEMDCMVVLFLIF